MSEVLKAKVIEGHKEEFEQYCKDHGIYFKPYPEPIRLTYRVECEREELHDMGHGISTLEAMPICTLS